MSYLIEHKCITEPNAFDQGNYKDKPQYEIFHNETLTILSSIFRLTNSGLTIEAKYSDGKMLIPTLNIERMPSHTSIFYGKIKSVACTGIGTQEKSPGFLNLENNFGIAVGAIVDDFRKFDIKVGDCDRWVAAIGRPFEGSGPASPNRFILQIYDINSIHVFS